MKIYILNYYLVWELLYRFQKQHGLSLIPNFEEIIHFRLINTPGGLVFYVGIRLRLYLYFLTSQIILRVLTTFLVGQLFPYFTIFILYLQHMNQINMLEILAIQHFFFNMKNPYGIKSICSNLTILATYLQGHSLKRILRLV